MQLDTNPIISVDTTNSAQIQYKTRHPILIDISNTATLSRSESTITGHEILRESARRNLQIYTEQMAKQMIMKNKRPNSYEIGDLVRIVIPKIDRSGIDRPTLPCKVIGVTENNQYLLGSKFGIINVYYSPGEIEPLGVIYFPELDNLPSNKISVRDCNSNRCRCKKIGSNCGSRCHSGRSCKNKCES